MSVKIYESLDHLPTSYQELFDEVGQQDFFRSLEWFANLIETTSKVGEAARLYGLENEIGVPKALLITRWQTSASRFVATRSLHGCSNLYSLSFAPICRTALPSATAIAEPFVQEMVRDQTWDTIRFDCWEQGSPFFDAFVTALRRHHFLVQTHFQFGNWFERVADQSFESYLGQRSTKLCNTLRRKQKRLEATGDVRFQIISSADQLMSGTEAYDRIYEASWKQPEPYATFTGGLIRAAASAGVLRLGILWIAGQPIAAQIWIVTGGRATVFKLAHREDHKHLSPGSLLTQYMLRKLFDAGGLQEIDFGRGDDAFKRLWVSQRRERWGIIAFNPQTMVGMLHAAAQFTGRAGKRLFNR